MRAVIPLSLASLVLFGCAVHPASFQCPPVQPEPAPVTAAATSGPVTEPGADLRQLPPDQAHEAVFDLWRQGHQSEAEHALVVLTRRYPRDQKLLFFRAACERSRFDVRTSLKLMHAVASLGPETVEGKAASLVNAIDLRRSVIDKNKLSRLALDHPDKLLVLWMAAVECRTLNLNESGVFLYGILVERLAPFPGPVLLHQTYANLLDEVNKFDQALREREVAVRMEPCGWSYQGMANTLTNLRRFEEADRAFARATRLQPDSPLYWETWGQSLMKWGHYADAMRKAEAALVLEPERCRSWNLWGQCLEKKGDLEGALEKYRQAMRVAPTDGWAYHAAADVLRRLDRRDESNEVCQAWQRIVDEREGGGSSAGVGVEVK